MAEHQLKISADTKQLKQSLTDLSRFAKKELGTSKIQLFSKETDRLLKGEAKNALLEVKKVSSNIKAEIDRQLQAIKKTTQGTKEQRTEVEKLLRLQKDLLKTKKAEMDLTKVMSRGMRSSSGSGFGKLLSPMNIGLAAGGAFGISRALGGMNQFESEIPNRLKLMGRGVRNFNLTEFERTQAAGVGLSRGALESQRLESMDAFGRTGATTGGVLQRSGFERNFGLETGTLTNLGSQFRQQVGGVQANQTVMKLQASLIASGIDDAVGPYLETAANMLMSINESGIVNQAEVLQALSSLTKETKIAPEIVSSHLVGLDSAIKGSSEDINAFLQTAFAKAGIGGGTIGGTQAAIKSGGLFGADVSRLTKDQQQKLAELGIGNTGFQKVSQAIINEFKSQGFKWGAGATNQELITAGTASMKVTNARNPVEGVTMLNLLEESAKGSKKASEELANLQIDPQLKNLGDIAKSGAGQLNTLQALHETIKSELGENLVPASKVMETALSSIDEAMNMVAPSIGTLANSMLSLLSVFGIETDQSKAKKAISGKVSLREKDIDELRGTQKQQLREDLLLAKSETESRLAKAKAESLGENIPTMESFASYSKSDIEVKDLENQLANIKKTLKLGSLEAKPLTQEVGPLRANDPKQRDAELIDAINKGFLGMIEAQERSTVKNIESRNQNTKKLAQKPGFLGNKPNRTIPE